MPGRPILWKCHMSTMTSGHYCHRDTVKIDNTVTSCASVALLSITFLHSHVVTYSVFLRAKIKAGASYRRAGIKPKVFAALRRHTAAPSLHLLLVPCVFKLQHQIRVIIYPWGGDACTPASPLPLYLSQLHAGWFPAQGWRRRGVEGRWGVAGWRNRRDPPRNLSFSPYTLVHNRSQSRSDQIGGSNSWFGMCAVPHRLL